MKLQSMKMQKNGLFHELPAEVPAHCKGEDEENEEDGERRQEKMRPSKIVNINEQHDMLLLLLISFDTSIFLHVFKLCHSFTICVYHLLRMLRLL